MKIHYITAIATLNLAFAASSFAGLNVAVLASQDSVIGDDRQTSAPGPGYLVDENSGRIGTGGSFGDSTREVRLPVLGFTLPTLDFSTITSVEIGFTVDNGREGTDGLIDDEQIDVYFVNSADPSGSGQDLYYFGASGSETSGTLVTDYIGGYGPTTDVGSGTTTIGESTSLTLTGDSLTSFLGLYTGVNPNQTEAFFRFTASASWNELSVTRFVLDNSQATLEITTVPEPSTYALLAGFGALALVMLRRRLK